MGFSLGAREGMATGLRRIVREELAAAIDDLEGRGPADRDAAVHDARKRLKKARAAVRLARFDVGKDVQRTETAVLRDAARRLSGVRDAHVLLETLAKLEADSGGALPAPATRALRQSLERRRDELHAATLEGGDGVAQSIADIREVHERAAGWPLRDEGFAATARGLERIYDRGRDAMRRAVEEGDDEAWHDWRKRVKDLWYSLRILKPVAPGQLSGPVDELDELSDVLGDHNDIAVLREAVEHRAEQLDPAQLELLRLALDRRRDALRLRAVPLGRRLYAEPAKRFVRRIAVYWDARAAQAAAEAMWLEPSVAARVRELLAAKASADTAGKRRIATRLNDLGFRVKDVADQVPKRRSGFSAEDFDALVAEGLIRIGSPGRAEAAPAARPAPATEPEPPPRNESAGGRGGPPSAGDLVRASAGLAIDSARWARGKLPG